MVVRIAFLLVFFYCQKSQAQFTSEPIIRQLAEYRSTLLTQNAESLLRLKMLTDKWDTYYAANEEILRITNWIVYYNIQGYDLELIKKRLIKDNYNSSIAHKVTDEDILTIIENIPLIELVYAGILSRKYPYQLSLSKYLVDQLTFLDLKSGHTIGEIGAGNGDFCLLLGLLEMDIEVYVNELEEHTLLQIAKKYNNTTFDIDRSKYHLIQGTETSTNLPEQSFDRLFLKNTLHHFTAKDEMLASIKSNLKPDGELVIWEDPRVKNDRDCFLAMKERKIYKVLDDAGFELIDSIKYETSLLLKFRIKAE